MPEINETKKVVKLYDNQDGFEQYILTDLTEAELVDAMNGYEEEDPSFEDRLHLKCFETGKEWEYYNMTKVIAP